MPGVERRRGDGEVERPELARAEDARDRLARDAAIDQPFEFFGRQRIDDLLRIGHDPGGAETGGMAQQQPRLAGRLLDPGGLQPDGRRADQRIDSHSISASFAA